MRLPSRASVILLALLSLAELPSMPAAAQSASQITPHSFSPPIQSNAEGGFTIGELPALETPAGADDLFVTLSSVSVSVESPELADAGAAVRAKLVGQRVSGGQIFAAARELEAAYAQAGYVLVRVILPPQELTDGAELHLTVIDGYIERIETAGVPAAVRRRIERVLRPLQGKRGLKLKEIERRILLASDTPGVLLRSTLAAGAETGAAVLLIEAKHEAIDGTLSGDNSLSRYLGSYQIGLGADLNSVFREGELTYLRADGDPSGGTNGFFNDQPRNRTLAAGFIAPLGIDGLTFNLEGTDAHTTPMQSGGSQSTDVFERLSVRLRYPWLRSRDFNWASQLMFDAESEHETLILPASLPLFDDRLRVLRVAQNWNGMNRLGGNFSGAFTTSYGFDGLGARSAAAATPALPLSRQGAGANFAKLEASSSYGQELAAHLNAAVTFRGQYAFGRALARSEQFGIADPDDLSAFDAGSLQGDSGVVVRAEVASPWSVPTRSTRVGLLASPYVFGAAGEVYKADPTAFEAAHVRGGSYGAGLRLGGGAAGKFSSASLALEAAHQTGGDIRDVSRFRLVAAFKF
ncbi:MAG: ShlB/FhaC/HecB family hemolysin secretion/activation protein [Gammaproteobacteria bacterium]|nr:ShlB/FhaC/HecB family hemolysin secretion/activation protein [Gammaproteobacteria bacterium]